VRKFATNAMNMNLPFTEGATDSVFAQQLIDFVKRDNQLAALSAPDLAACVVVSRTVGPNVDQSKHLPNYKLIEDPGSFTLKKADWNREERFYDLKLLPEAKKNQYMPESDWPGICNMVFEALTIAEATGGGIMCEKETKITGKGVKAVMSRDIMAAVSIKLTGRYPADQGGQQATKTELAWAQDYKPCRSAAK
jgi:hypothetical protein